MAIPEKPLHSIPSQLAADHHTTCLIDPMNLEDLLGKIETDGDNAHVDGPPVCGNTTPITLWHLDAEGQRSSTPSTLWTGAW